MTKTLAVLFISALFVFAQRPEAHRPTPPPASPLGPISLTASKWQDFGDQNNTNPPGPKITNTSSGALSVALPEVTAAQLAKCVPSVDCNSLNYLYTPLARNLTGGTCNFLQGAIVQGYCVTVTFQVVTTGAPIFNWALNPDNSCTGGCYPAGVWLLLQHKNDDWAHEYYRWWSNNVAGLASFVPLGQGVFTLTVPLISDWWIDVYGNRSQSELNATLSNMGNIGVTFGGGFYTAHGDNVSNGSATIQITGMAITQ